MEKTVSHRKEKTVRRGRGENQTDKRKSVENQTKKGRSGEKQPLKMIYFFKINVRNPSKKISFKVLKLLMIILLLSLFIGNVVGMENENEVGNQNIVPTATDILTKLFSKDVIKKLIISFILQSDRHTRFLAFESFTLLFQFSTLNKSIYTIITKLLDNAYYHIRTLPVYKQFFFFDELVKRNHLGIEEESNSVPNEQLTNFFEKNELFSYSLVNSDKLYEYVRANPKLYNDYAIHFFKYWCYEKFGTDYPQEYPCKEGPLYCQATSKFNEENIDIVFDLFESYFSNEYAKLIFYDDQRKQSQFSINMDYGRNDILHHPHMLVPTYVSFVLQGKSKFIHVSYSGDANLGNEIFGLDVNSTITKPWDK